MPQAANSGVGYCHMAGLLAGAARRHWHDAVPVQGLRVQGGGARKHLQVGACLLVAQKPLSSPWPVISGTYVGSQSELEVCGALAQAPLLPTCMVNGRHH